MTAGAELLPQTIEHEHVALNVPISSEDRAWLEALGSSWPDADNEESWLAHMNQLVANGSVWVKGADPDTGGPHEVVLESRETFLDSLTALDKTTRQEFKDHHLWTMPLDTIVDTQRVLHNYRINAAKTINSSPNILTYAPETVNKKLEDLTTQGIDAAKAVDGFPVLLGLGSEGVSRKLNILYSAARAWGISDYRTTVNGLVEDWPTILAYKPLKLRTLVRVASYSLPALTEPDIEARDIRSNAITNIEATLSGYLLERQDIQKPSDIRRHAKRYNKLGREALLGIIVSHKDDPAVKVYLREYPLKLRRSSDHLDRLLARIR